MSRTLLVISTHPDFVELGTGTLENHALLKIVKPDDIAGGPVAVGDSVVEADDGSYAAAVPKPAPVSAIDLGTTEVETPVAETAPPAETETKE